MRNRIAKLHSGGHPTIYRLTSELSQKRFLTQLRHRTSSHLPKFKLETLSRADNVQHTLRHRLSSSSSYTLHDRNLAVSNLADRLPFSYQGPLTKTFRRLKLFSLSSFTLSGLLAPFMFVIESSLPFEARLALATTAIVSSGLSTALIAWCGKPYVSELYVSSDESRAIKLHTSTVFLRPLITTVYDPTFLIETRRPFAKWELTQTKIIAEKDTADTKTLEETIADTTDANGRIIGKWIVSWKNVDNKMVGSCKGMGRIVRYFNVHEELLPASLRQL